MTINQRIKYLREEVLHLTQKDFSIRLGMKQGVLSFMENRNQKIKDESLCLIGKEYNVNMNWLMLGNGPIFNDTKSLRIDDTPPKSYTGNDVSALKQHIELLMGTIRAKDTLIAQLNSTIQDKEEIIKTLKKSGKSRAN